MVLSELLSVGNHGAPADAVRGLAPRGDEAVPVGREEGGGGSTPSPVQHGRGQALLTQGHADTDD